MEPSKYEIQIQPRHSSYSNPPQPITIYYWLPGALPCLRPAITNKRELALPGNSQRNKLVSYNMLNIVLLTLFSLSHSSNLKI